MIKSYSLRLRFKRMQRDEPQNHRRTPASFNYAAGSRDQYATRTQLLHSYAVVLYKPGCPHYGQIRRHCR